MVPILSFIHILEFGNREEPYLSRATSYVDQVTLLARIPWICGLPAVVKAEVQNAFLSCMGLPQIPLCPFGEHLVDVLKENLGEFDREYVRTMKFSDIVKMSGSLDSRERYSAFRRSSPATAATSLFPSAEDATEVQFRLTSRATQLIPESLDV